MLVKNYSIQSKMYYSFKKLLLVSCYTNRDKLQKVFDALSFFALWLITSILYHIFLTFHIRTRIQVVCTHDRLS